MTARAITDAFALDARGLDRLRLNARESPETAVKEAARQFEVMFLDMLLKSMRDASLQDGLLSGERVQQYTAMLDQQLAQSLSARGMGLADAMLRQLQRQLPAASGVGALVGGDPVPPAVTEPASPQAAPASPGGTAGSRVPAGFDRVRRFVDDMWPHAVDAGRATGIPPHFILAQAALESGWGQREIRAADGTPSYNLFGIKATRGWPGGAVDCTTTEYTGGERRNVVERFRAYGSHAEAFRDYANLIRGNPRYAGVIATGGDPAAFARALQQAGYATDPAYADKLARVINGTALRRALAV